MPVARNGDARSPRVYSIQGLRYPPLRGGGKFFRVCVWGGGGGGRKSQTVRFGGSFAFWGEGGGVMFS